MTLTELIHYIKGKFPQSTVESNVFSFEKGEYVRSVQPKHFFRGESRLYEKTNTTFLRLIENRIFEQSELNEFFYIHHHLYLFLREAIWDISVVEEKEHGIPNLELSVAGILQHYGFDTSFLDVTSSLEIAANFASMNDIGENGKLLVIESDGLNKEEINYYFDLTKCIGNRPKKQESYVIWDQSRNLDLKDYSFLSKHNGKWFEFELTKQDKQTFYNPSILSTQGDDIANHIIEWWEYSDIKKIITSDKTRNYINAKVEKLNNQCD